MARPDYDSMTNEEVIAALFEDDNVWWWLSTGKMQNLFEHQTAEVERLKETLCRVKDVRRQSNGMILPDDIIAEIEATGPFLCPHDKEVERMNAHNALLLAVAKAANKHQSCFMTPPCNLCAAVGEAKQKGAMP